MGFGEIIREFGVKVTLDFDPKKIDQAQQKIEKFGAKLGRFAAEVAGLTAGVFEFQNAFTANARSLQNQADLLGISTKSLQEYEYAAKVAANANREDLVGSLQTLADTMDKARAGDVASRQALEQIGAAGGNTAMILGRLNDPTYKTTDAFNDLSKGISLISRNSPQAASRLTELTLGSTKLYNLLRQGPNAIQQLTAEGGKNFALNDKMIRQGAEMDKQMSKLWMTFRKMGYEIGYSVMRHLAPMISQFQKWFAANKQVISSGINIFLDTLATALKVIWEDSLKIVEVMGSLVSALGGTRTAVQALIAAWIGMKALDIGASFLSMVGGIYRVIPVFHLLLSTMRGVGAAFKAFSLIEGIADILPALQLFGSGAVAALTPLLPYILAIGAAAVGIHDLMTILSGGSFKDTWTGKGWEKVKDGVGWVGNKISGMNAQANEFIAPKASIPAGLAAAGAGGVTQENHFSTTQTIMVPPGTTSTQAAAMISKATVDSHEQMMVKAKLDAGRSRRY